MRIRLVLAKTKFKEVKIDVPEKTTRKQLEKFAADKFPGYDIVDVIEPGQEDYDLPLTSD